MTRYLAVIALGLLACERTSATDKERHHSEMREMLARNAERGEHEREMREIHAEFTARFAGKIQPGVGCDVCPLWCEMGDLRQIPVPELHRLYREAALTFGYGKDPRTHRLKDNRTHQLAWLELQRLGCIAKDGLPATREAWLLLLGAAEDPAIRYAAAVQAIQHDIAPEPAFRSLEELVAGSSEFVVAARIVLDEWTIGIIPSL